MTTTRVPADRGQRDHTDSLTESLNPQTSGHPVQLGTHAYHTNDILSYKNKQWIVKETRENNTLLLEEYAPITLEQLHDYDFPENWRHPQQLLVRIK